MLSLLTLLLFFYTAISNAWRNFLKISVNSPTSLRMADMVNTQDKISIADRFDNETASSLFCFEVSKYGIDTALAEEHISLGNYEEAIRLAKEAVSIAQHTGESENIYEAYANGILADALYRIGSYQVAAEKYRQALSAYEHRFASEKGPEMIELLGATELMAFTMVNTNEYDDAIKACSVALGMTEKMLGPTTSDAADAIINLATAYMNNGDIGKGPEALYKRALEIHSSLLNNQKSEQNISIESIELANKKIAICYMGIGNIFYKRVDYVKAKEYYLKIEEMAKRSAIVRSDFHAGFKNLALIHWRNGEGIQASNLLKILLYSMELSTNYGHSHEATKTIKQLLDHLISNTAIY
eukprot:gene5305-7369_t